MGCAPVALKADFERENGGYGVNKARLRCTVIVMSAATTGCGDAFVAFDGFVLIEPSLARSIRYKAVRGSAMKAITAQIVMTIASSIHDNRRSTMCDTSVFARQLFRGFWLRPVTSGKQ